MAGNAELPNEEYIQIGLQRVRHLERDRDTAAGQTEHQGRRVANKLADSLTQDPASFKAVTKQWPGITAIQGHHAFRAARVLAAFRAALRSPSAPLVRTAFAAARLRLAGPRL